MPVAEAPEDDEVRQTYNFAPGSHGLVYRADVPDYGAGDRRQRHEQSTEDGPSEDGDVPAQMEDPKETKYKLQVMKWGVWDSLPNLKSVLEVSRAEIMQQDWFLSGRSAIQTMVPS